MALDKPVLWFGVPAVPLIALSLGGLLPFGVLFWQKPQLLSGLGGAHANGTASANILAAGDHRSLPQRPLR